MWALGRDALGLARGVRQLPRLSLGDRICACARPKTRRVRWESLFLMVCLRCECFFTDDTRKWPNADRTRSRPARA
jgi:hypothetical protein